MANKVGTHRPKSASALPANILYKKVPAHLKLTTMYVNYTFMENGRGGGKK